MTQFRGFLMPAPKLASDIYNEAARPKATRRYFRCVDCAAIVEPLTTRCEQCTIDRRRSMLRAFSGRKHNPPARVIAEAHTQLTGKREFTERCGECRLPALHCKCADDIPAIKEGYIWR